MDFLGDFGLRDRFQERIAPKSIEIDMDKLRIKFSALNINFETCARGHHTAVPP